MEERRLRAAELFAQHVHQAEVARTLGVSPQTVSRWHARWQADGVAGLASLWPPGRTPRVSDAQLQQAELAPLEGAKAHGFDTDLWTLSRVAAVIWRLTGVRHHPAHVWRLLRHRLDWSLQRPARRAVERDEQAIRGWVARDWPRIKKRQAPQGGHLLLRRVGRLADPSCFALFLILFDDRLRHAGGRDGWLRSEEGKHRRCLIHPHESDPSMLPDGTIPGWLAGLLVVFRSCFTAPTFTTFSGLVVG